MVFKMWKTTLMDEAIAEELFGWRWMSYVGIPVRGTPTYPTEQRVRRFFPPDSLSDERWIAHFANHEASPATGDEPLDYAYCSSMGPAIVPHFSGDLNECRKMELEIRKRQRWNAYIEALALQHEPKTGMSERDFLILADPESRCLAALVAVGSKYIVKSEPQGA